MVVLFSRKSSLSEMSTECVPPIPDCNPVKGRPQGRIGDHERTSMRTTMEYGSLSDRLFEVVPEIREDYEQQFKNWEEVPSPSLAFSNVLAPYLAELGRNNNSDRLKSILEFLETLATHEDPKVVQISLSIVYDVINRRGFKRNLWLECLGPVMRKMLEELEYPPEYASLNDELIEVVPEIKGAYEDELKWYGGDQIPGPHVVFADILIPHLARVARRGDETRLREVFGYLERLARHANSDIRDVVALSVIAPLVDQCPKELWVRYLGPELEEMLTELESS